MLTLDAFDVFIPDFRVPVKELEIQTDLPKAMLSIYHLIYGLETISVYSGNLESLISIPLDQLWSSGYDVPQIKYFIYVHTTGIVLPWGDDLLSRLKKKYSLHSVISLGMSMQKCVSYFKALEIMSVLLSHSNYSALVITGEVAFSPQLRVVPRSSLVGDAATAALFSTNGEDHQLLSVVNQYVPGYAKGIYLSETQMRHFDAQFIQLMVDIIKQALFKASILIDQVTLILPHNVNIPTWKKIASALYFPIDKIELDNIAQVGHAFCSDHLINLKSALINNRLKKGDYYLWVGCGMGFYLSAAVFRY